jgi:hypothetical protein
MFVELRGRLKPSDIDWSVWALELRTRPGFVLPRVQPESHESVVKGPPERQLLGKVS